MPTRTSRVCSRCRASVPPGPCPTCDQPWIRKPTSWSGGSTRRWRRLRQAKLDRNAEDNDGLCERPACRRLAVEVHHDGGFTTERERYEWRRLQALCHECHAEETAAQARLARGSQQ